MTMEADQTCLRCEHLNDHVTCNRGRPVSVSGPVRCADFALSLDIQMQEQQLPRGVSVMVIPGVKYGIYVGQLLPSCRSIETMLHWLSKYDEGECEIKLYADINDDDCCQRGPDGKPLGRMTPLVPFQTKAEWEAVCNGRQ